MNVGKRDERNAPQIEPKIFGRFYKLWVPFMGVLVIRALPFGVSIKTPGFLKLP